MMRNIVVIEQFLKQRRGTADSLKTYRSRNGQVLYSYDEPIAFIDPRDPLTVHYDRTSNYSRTSTAHRNMLAQAVAARAASRGFALREATRADLRSWAGDDPNAPFKKLPYAYRKGAEGEAQVTHYDPGETYNPPGAPKPKTPAVKLSDLIPQNGGYHGEVQVDDITQAALEVAGHESWLNGPDVCVLSADPAGGQMATIFDDEGNKIVLHGSIGFGSEADDEHKANLVLLLNELGFPQAPVLLKTKSNGLTLQASGDATLHNIEVE